MPDEAALSDLLLAAERALMSPEVRTKPDRLRALLSPDFREVGRSGRSYTLSDMLAVLPKETAPLDVEIDDFETLRLSETVALVTYSTRRRTGDGVLTTKRSSIWRLEGGGLWRMVFHQGTPVP